MSQQNDHSTCPHCGQRVIKNADKCLHCGKYVKAGQSSSGGSSGDGISMSTILVIAIVVLGGGCFISMGSCGNSCLNFMQGGASQGAVEFNEQSTGTSTVCLQGTQTQRISQLQADGYREIQGQNGLRCFQK